MENTRAFEELIASIEADGMVVEQVELATSEVVFLKSVLEGYPGIAAVHAPAGYNQGPRTRLMLSTTPGLADELSGVLDDIATEIELTRQVQ